MSNNSRALRFHQFAHLARHASRHRKGEERVSGPNQMSTGTRYPVLGWPSHAGPCPVPPAL